MKPASAPAFVLVALVTLGAAGAHADTYAVLPAAGDAFAPVLDEIAKQTRKALVDSGVDVQQADVTAKQLTDLSTSGVQCKVSDDDCALRIGLAGGVDVVVTETVSVVGSRLLLKVSAVSTASDAKPKHIYGELSMKDNGASVANAVKRLVGKKDATSTLVPINIVVTPANALLIVDQHAGELDDGKLWLAPGTHPVDVRAPGYKTLSTSITVKDDAIDTVTWTLEPQGTGAALTPEANATNATNAASSPGTPPGSTTPAFGFTPPLLVAASGGAVAIIGFGVAGVTEAMLAQPQPPSSRATTRTIGLVSFVTACVGGVAAAGGGIWAVLE